MNLILKTTFDAFYKLDRETYPDLIENKGSADEGTRTPTLAHQILSLARLPITTHPQIKLFKNYPIQNQDFDLSGAQK
jgi:hypothetical protein